MPASLRGKYFRQEAKHAGILSFNYTFVRTWLTFFTTAFNPAILSHMESYYHCATSEKTMRTGRLDILLVPFSLRLLHQRQWWKTRHMRRDKEEGKQDSTRNGACKQCGKKQVSCDCTVEVKEDHLVHQSTNPVALYTSTQNRTTLMKSSSILIQTGPTFHSAITCCHLQSSCSSSKINKYKS